MSGLNEPKPPGVSAWRPRYSGNCNSYSRPLSFPCAVYGYTVVFVIYQVVIVLLLFMPNVNCQAWSDLKHFLKSMTRFTLG